MLCSLTSESALLRRLLLRLLPSVPRLRLLVRPLMRQLIRVAIALMRDSSATCKDTTAPIVYPPSDPELRCAFAEPSQPFTPAAFSPACFIEVGNNRSELLCLHVLRYWYH
jgi:hypothetical protein